VIERGYEGYVAKDEASVYEGRAIEAVAEGQAEGRPVEEDRWRRRLFEEPPTR
jgi:hypothetical protein